MTLAVQELRASYAFVERNINLVKRYWTVLRRPSRYYSLGFLTIGGFIARAWIAAAGLVVAALAFDDRAGLSVALLLIALFTVYFAHRIVTHSAPGGIA